MTTSTAAEPQAPAPQQRRLRTDIPGPASRALRERRANVVAAGGASTVGAYITSASGGLPAAEFVEPGITEPDADLTKRVAAVCHALGVVALTCGTYGNVVRLLPPLSLSDELLDEGLSVLDHAIHMEART